MHSQMDLTVMRHKSEQEGEIKLAGEVPLGFEWDCILGTQEPPALRGGVAKRSARL